MIGFISGKLDEIDGNMVTINCGGVGYDVMVSQTTLIVWAKLTVMQKFTHT